MKRGTMAVIFVSAILLTAGASTAQDYTHPRDMDLPQVPVRYPNPEALRMQLPNGLTAYVVEEPAVSLVSLTAAIRAGAAFDDAIAEGAAQALAAVWRRVGTTRMTDTAFAELLHQLAGTYAVTLTPEVLQIDLQVSREDVETAMRLLSGLLREPNLSAEALQQIRQAGLEPFPRPAGAESGPVLYEGSLDFAVGRFLQLLYAQHPYGRKPTSQQWQRLQPQEVSAFHSTYVVPGNMVLAVAGAVPQAALRDLVKRYFADWPARPVPPIPGIPALSTERPRRIHAFRAEALQGWVVLGHELPRVPFEDEAPLEVMNYILGGGHFDTRLFRETRDKRGMTNDDSGYLDALWYGPGSYTFRTYGRPEVVPLLVEITLREIERIRNEPVTEEELLVAKGALAEGQFAMWFENGHATARTLALEWLREGHHRRTRTYVERIRSVTKEDVQRAARRYLHPERMQMVLVGPVERILKLDRPDASMRLQDFGEVVMH